MLFIAEPLWFLHWPQGNGSRFLSSTLISDIRSQIKEAKKKAIFPSDVSFTLHLWKTVKRRCMKMNINDYQPMMTERFCISVGGQEFPSWCGLENKWKRPPRCCSTRWARDVMIIYSPSIGSAFEKCWCWEKMVLHCLKGKPQGGQMLWYSSKGIAAGPHGCSLPSREKLCWVTPTQLSRRSWEMAGNEQRHAPQVTLLHLPMRERGKIWSDCTNL